MLKALELAGFKSFADRTRFEFPRGVSVVVGPNGSGKSNIVDAVKWVLGSQSAKSLRGKEMIDVIFNGCASRGPSGTGEVTLTLDNESGQLPLDAKEVHVTRRVYRSGEGEYLINRQPCRLRDIRDLLVGTGITTEAYCIIEQGRVDALLQASPRDRRVVFEEAAGISQFKSKKAAAMRRLERVEQNLLRLSDIVDEVESRLRSVRSQAGRARRYRECTERLKHLRTALGLADWHTLTRDINTREAQLAELQQRAGELAAALETAEARLGVLDRSLEVALGEQREFDAAASATREQIAAGQAAIEHQRERHGDVTRDIDRVRRQLAATNSRGEHAGEQFGELAAQLRLAEAELATAMTNRQQSAQDLEQLIQELDNTRLVMEQVRIELAQSDHAIHRLGHRIDALDATAQSAREVQEQNRQRLASLARQRDRHALEAERLEQAEAALECEAQSQQDVLRAAEQQLAYVRGELARADKQHRQLESQITRTRERITVLSELEQRLEGLDSGVQDVLRLAREEPEGPFGEVCGVVADLFHVDVDTAHLIEAALGERAQFVVVATANRLWERAQREPLGIGGKIGFLRLDTRTVPSALDHVDLSAEEGVMGRADQFIETAGEFAPLVKRLLGRTWLVDRLATALRLAQAAGRGFDFVTSDGELLAADGTLIVGPRSIAAGIMSRRSELRSCHEQSVNLEQQLAHCSSACSRLDRERVNQEALIAATIASYSDLTGKLAGCRQRSAAARAELAGVMRDLQSLEGEVELANQRIAEAASDYQAATAQRLAAETNAAQLRDQLASLQQALAHCEQHRAQLQAEFVERQVLAAKCEQRVEMLRQQHESSQRNTRQRAAELAEMRARLAELDGQLSKLEENMLVGRQELASLYLCKERQILDRSQQIASHDLLRRDRADWTNQVRETRQQLAALQGQQHKLDAATSRLQHDRQTLSDRMQDDYGIDLAEEARSTEQGAGSEEPGTDRNSPLPAPRSPLPSLDRAAVEREIAQLRDQINGIGAVNLEALDELEALEVRFGTLSAQYRDLVDAKASLERIVQRINVDSRQLFLATLELVRGHFQQLFRRMFGGGEADIVVDEAEDVLESGIEIVARPPGKEACSISLLSGGEKTLTCVALLLAVFRSKPSPFCILDEVDAALDEANIGRFSGVLREFLSFTQFVVVTHSKKTMSVADTLYGVTMEEAGVSKRVSVRFEDVSEDGQIRPSAQRLRNEPQASPASIAENREVARRAA